MHDDDGLSPTHEMYLKVLYRLQMDNEIGRVRDMARGLGVTPGTVSAVLKKLERSGLILHDHYGFVKLTPGGMRAAECVVRRFEVVRSLLVDVLGVEPDSAEADACLMEHAICPATVNRMETLVQFVHAGRIDVSPMQHLRPSISVCTTCESRGACHAIVALPGNAPNRSSNRPSEESEQRIRPEE